MTNRHSARLARVERAVAKVADARAPRGPIVLWGEPRPDDYTDHGGPVIVWGSSPDARISTLDQ